LFVQVDSQDEKEEDEEKEADLAQEDEKEDTASDTPTHYIQCDKVSCQKWRILTQPPWVWGAFECNDLGKRCAEKCDGCGLKRCECDD
jgi:hypothetical protein